MRRSSRELVLHNPYWATWIAAVAAAKHGLDGKATKSRMIAEAALRFGSTEAVYDGTSGAFSRKVKMAGGATRQLTDERIADQLRRFSLYQGVDPDPVGVTAWSQPWVPLWLEWEIVLDLGDRLEGWSLASVDLQAAAGADGAPATPTTRTLRGRSMLTTGTATTLSGAVRTWLDGEEQRDHDGTGEASEATEAALARIAAAVDQLDVVSASLDGVREQLLGLAYHGGPLSASGSDDDTLSDPNLSGDAALWLRGGTARLQRARLVDAFGRTPALPRRPGAQRRSGLRWRRLPTARPRRSTVRPRPPAATRCACRRASPCRRGSCFASSIRRRAATTPPRPTST